MESASHPSDAPRPAVGAGHEARDVAAAPIALSAFALAAICVGVFIAMLLLFRAFAAREARQSAPPSPLAAYGPQEPPAPRLQASPIQDLRALHARDAAALGRYAWVDRDAGVVRIPIERAIELLAQRGLPARSAPAGSEP